MAQANSVPTRISRPITDATSKASTKPYSSDQVDLGAKLGAREDETTFPPVRPEKWDEHKPKDQVADSTEALNRRWYETITGQMPVGRYIVAVCYATAGILLGGLPWNTLLILLLFSNSERLRLDTFDAMPSGRLGSSQ